MSDKPKELSRWYNGFSPEDRDRLSRPQYSAFRSGKVQRPVACLACGLDDGRILTHLEDYTMPLDFLPLCYGCHKALHERFRFPAMFEAWTIMVANGWQPEPFDTLNWQRWMKVYGHANPAFWPGRNTATPGEIALFEMVPRLYVDFVPDNLAISRGAAHLPGQHVWTKRSALVDEA